MLTAATICLALNVFYEARSESTRGQHAVAHVTLNRVGSEIDDPSKVCKVVFEKDQFSWTANHKKPLKRFVKIAELAKKTDEKAWGEAVNVAHKVINKKSKDITKGATYFNEKKMGRRYKTTVVATIIGDHIFY